MSTSYYDVDRLTLDPDWRSDPKKSLEVYMNLPQLVKQQAEMDRAAAVEFESGGNPDPQESLREILARNAIADAKRRKEEEARKEPEPVRKDIWDRLDDVQAWWFDTPEQTQSTGQVEKPETPIEQPTPSLGMPPFGAATVPAAHTTDPAMPPPGSTSQVEKPETTQQPTQPMGIPPFGLATVPAAHTTDPQLRRLPKGHEMEIAKRFGFTFGDEPATGPTPAARAVLERRGVSQVPPGYRGSLGEATATVGGIVAGGAADAVQTIIGHTAKLAEVMGFEDAEELLSDVQMREFLQLNPKGSGLRGAAESIVQFYIGYVAMAPVGMGVRAAGAGIQGGRMLRGAVDTAATAIQAGAASALVFDPFGERVTTMLEQVPVLGDIIPDWLSAPEDPETGSYFRGMVKNALEEAGLGAFAELAVKGITAYVRYMRRGGGGEQALPDAEPIKEQVVKQMDEERAELDETLDIVEDAQVDDVGPAPQAEPDRYATPFEPVSTPDARGTFDNWTEGRWSVLREAAATDPQAAMRLMDAARTASRGVMMVADEADPDLVPLEEAFSAFRAAPDDPEAAAAFAKSLDEFETVTIDKYLTGRRMAKERPDKEELAEIRKGMPAPEESPFDLLRKDIEYTIKYPTEGRVSAMQDYLDTPAAREVMTEQEISVASAEIRTAAAKAKEAVIGPYVTDALADGRPRGMQPNMLAAASIKRGRGSPTEEGKVAGGEYAALMVRDKEMARWIEIDTRTKADYFSRYGVREKYMTTLPTSYTKAGVNFMPNAMEREASWFARVGRSAAVELDTIRGSLVLRGNLDPPGKDWENAKLLTDLVRAAPNADRIAMLKTSMEGLRKKYSTRALTPTELRMLAPSEETSIIRTLEATPTPLTRTEAEAVLPADFGSVKGDTTFLARNPLLQDEMQPYGRVMATDVEKPDMRPSRSYAEFVERMKAKNEEVAAARNKDIPCAVGGT